MRELPHLSDRVSKGDERVDFWTDDELLWLDAALNRAAAQRLGEVLR